DLRRDHPEVLRDQRQAPERVAGRAQKLVPGYLAPRALAGARGAGRHLPGLDEAAKVIEAQEVATFELVAEALDPPAETLRAQRFPVEQRIAPELAVLGECVRRHAGHGRGAALIVQPEQVPV